VVNCAVAGFIGLVVVV
jgi:hypothetical protein